MQYFSPGATSDETGPHILPLVAKGLMLDKVGRPGPDTVFNWAAGNGLPQRVQRILKAAQAAAISGNPAYAGALLGQDGAVAAGAWSQSLRTTSAFFRMKADAAFTAMPLNARIAIVTAGATAALVAEGKAKPIGNIALANLTLTPTKVAVILISTADLVADLSSEGQALFSSELKNAVSVAVDAEFLRQIGTGTAITGTADPWADLKAAVNAVDLRGNSKPYWISSVTAQKALATRATAGQGSFPTVPVSGSGELFGIPLLMTDALAAGSIVLLDAASIGAGSTEIDLAASKETSIEMSNTPASDASTGTGSAMTSLFQTNSVALRAECSLAVEVLRTGSIATITGSTWGA